MKKGFKNRFAWMRYLFHGDETTLEGSEETSGEGMDEALPEGAAKDITAGESKAVQNNGPEAGETDRDDAALSKTGLRRKKKKKRRGIDDEDPVSFRTATGPLSVQQVIYYTVRDLLYASGPMFTYIGITIFWICIGYPLSGRTAEGFQKYLEEYSNPLVAVGVVFTLRNLYRKSKKRGSTFFEDASLFVKDTDPKKILLGVFFGAGAALFLSAVLTLIPKVWIFATYDQKVKVIYQRYDILLTIIESALLTPLVEEIIFRGYMLNRLLKRWADLPAMIVTTLIFSFMHGSSVWFIYAFVMGWIIALISMREKNILYGIFVHAGFNIPSVVQWFIYFMHPSLQEVPVVTGTFRVVLIGMAGLAALVLSAVLYRKKYCDM